MEPGGGPVAGVSRGVRVSVLCYACVCQGTRVSLLVRNLLGLQKTSDKQSNPDQLCGLSWLRVDCGVGLGVCVPGGLTNTLACFSGACAQGRLNVQGPKLGTQITRSSLRHRQSHLTPTETWQCVQHVTAQAIAGQPVEQHS